LAAKAKGHGAGAEAARGSLQAPRPEQLGKFVARLQRLLTGGEFVNTYKLALLLALTRWAVEHADHDERQPVGAAAGDAA
jgi:hypothetical protein